MCPPVVRTRTFLTLLGGGPTHLSHIKQSLKIAPILVAADSGADSALRAGHMPAAVIGDMDSISEMSRAAIDPGIFHHIDDQHSTDFEKCLTRIEAPLILAHGFSGGLLDHQLAACNALVRHPAQSCILMGRDDICFLAPLEFDIDLPHGTRFSLFPMGEVQGVSEGLLYPIEEVDMSPGHLIGTSNTVTGPVRLKFSSRHMLVLLPRTQLQVVLRALGKT
ncbi:MAG: thiamine diphosphokinase [Paracoccaceae bacterium]